ncbi:competence protein CoiA family protein [Streptomyces sp. NPDC002755]|uniref:competence protein CoiA family protein n=1 Tax=Streptomyces sp. NPDC002884 TaxID=3154544 RepID=UPI00331C1125
MANGVWHSGLQRILELDKEDLGLGGTWPRLPELIESLLQPVAERYRGLLVCVENSQGNQCKAELSGVKSPHMYVRKHRGPDGVLRLRAAHLPTTHAMTPEESDRHKAMKDFLARTGEGAGLEVHVEKATRNRTSRPDVTIIGAGGVSLGCEAQYYNASAGTVLRRSRAHAEAGLAANWITHDDRFHLIDRSNWMLTRQMTWREISNAADLVLVGGFRVLVEWCCTASAERPCPDGRAKTGCGKVHLQWDTPRRLDDEGTGWTGHEGNTQRITVGQTLIGAATGSVTPLFASSRKDRRSGAYMWVPASDRIRWTDYRSEEATLPEEQPVLDEHIRFSGRDADDTCNFGDDTWVPSAPLERRGIYGVELTFTADNPAPVRTALAPGPSHADETRAAPGLAAPDIPQPRSEGWLPSLDDEGPTPAPAHTQPFAGHDNSTMPAPTRQFLVPAQPLAPEAKTAGTGPGGSTLPPAPEAEPISTGLPASLIALQRAADLERGKLEMLDQHDERDRQRRVWLTAAAAAQDAVTRYARAEGLNRSDVEQELRHAVKNCGNASE